MAAAVATAAAVALGACSGGDEPSTETIASTRPTTSATAPSTSTTTTTIAPVRSTSTTSMPTTSTSSTTSSVAASTSAPTAASRVVLGPDGIGAASFGAEPEGVIAYVSALLGPPDEDSGWVAAVSEFGACPGTEVRGTSWGDLQLLFGDESWAATGQRHLFAYHYGPAAADQLRPAGLVTDRGVSVGSSVAELRASYPDVQTFPGEEGIAPPSFYVSDVLAGFLTGTADDDVVTSILGGEGCGE